MAKNIKKRSASHIYFGVNKLTGELKHRPVVPAGPTQEELDAEYIRICQSYDPTSDEWTVDRYNRRWIMCTVCGRIKQEAQMSYYGGKGGANRGVCADCSRNGRS